MDERTAAVQAWAAREAEQTSTVTGRTAVLMWALWQSMTLAGWYEATNGQAIRSVTILEQARRVAAGLGAAYVRQIMAATAVPTSPTSPALPAARRGADLAAVYDRPAEAFRRKFSVTGDVELARTDAETRLLQLVEMDLLVARRDGEHQALLAAASRDRAAGTPRVTGYRRIIHPELSETGVCGLCIAASDRLYRLDELLPLHHRCKCTVAQVTEDYDPAEANEVDLAAIYDAAGSTDGRALKETRWQVNEHGELGPLLTRAGDNFQHAGDAPRGDPRERAQRELPLLEQVLGRLEERATAGQDVTGALAYQRDRIDLLRRVAA